MEREEGVKEGKRYGEGGAEEKEEKGEKGGNGYVPMMDVNSVGNYCWHSRKNSAM
jgi:hypothetical protein